MQILTDAQVEQFIKSLQSGTIAKILRTIDLLQKFGYRIGMPHSKKISNNLFELRVRGQQEVRIFYCYYKNEIYLLHGFVKKSQKTPTKELTRAKAKFQALNRQTGA